MATHKTDYYIPTKRYHHTTHIVGEYLYMWGGGIEGLPRVHNNKVKKRMTSVIEVFHLTTGTWEQRLTKGKPPLGIWAYDSTVISNKIYYFGGRCNHDECYHNSLNSLTIDSLTWNELFSTSSKKGPMMKAGCGIISVTFDSEDYLLVVGGWGHPPNTRQPGAQYSGIGHVRTNEHHYYELTSGHWLVPDITGEGPPPCSSFSMTSISNNRALLFGGDTPDGRDNTLYIAQCMKHAVHWQKLSETLPESMKWPHSRGDHAATVINDLHLMIVGGYDTRDSWLFNIDTKSWTNLTLPESVTKRVGHSLSTWNVSTTTVWVIQFGGTGSFNDTTVIELTCEDDQWFVGDVITNLKSTEKYQLKLQQKRQETSLQPFERQLQQLRRELQKKHQLITELQQNEVTLQNEQRLLQQQLQESQEREGVLRHANAALQQQVQQLQDRSHWVVRREEIEMTDVILGRGGWGEVKVAKFCGLKVAAKCLHEVILSPYNISVFTREMEIAARVRHPNLLQFIGATRMGTPIILSELMPTSLRKELEAGLLPYHAVLAIGEDIACALNYLHLFKPDPIIHRDVSTANVLLQMLGGGWRAKVSDYGSANLQPMIGETVNPGNPVYSAPEAGIPREHSPAMDVYSYGVVLIEMMICHIPEVAERQLHINTIQRQSFRALIERCLKEDRRKRPTMSEIITDFNEII